MRFRNFVFTSFRILSDAERETLFSNPDIRFITYQHERCPTTGREHLQGYCELIKQLSIPNIRLLLLSDGPEHRDYLYIATRRGSAEQARAYANKDDTRILGPFTHGTISSPGVRSDLRIAMDRLGDGRSLDDLVLDETVGDTVIKHFRFFENCHLLLKNKPRDFKSNVIFVWGPTGTGKSRLAYENGAKDITLTQSGFIVGYNHEDVVCFDDVTGDTFKRETFLKLMDRHPCTINVKGMSNVQWNPKTIYITSNFAPEVILNNDAACLRRIDQVIHLTGAEGAPSEVARL